MKKRYVLSALSLSLVILSLTSCVFLNHDRPANIGDNFYFDNPKYSSDDSAAYMNKDYVAQTVGQLYMPSTGESSILVVPVQFSDEDYQFTSIELKTLENTFFGTSDQTGWESVASFYEESSNGELQITGEVTNPISLNVTASEFALRASTYTGGNYTDVLLSEIMEELASEGMSFSQFDQNNDHYIDAVWLVYSAPFDSDSDIFWAYTTWALDEKSYSGYHVCPYSWASIDFLYEGNYGHSVTSGDAHTFIHETGHLLGLDDYYSYDADRETNFDTPVGGVDMMDFNIGDHCSFSKYLLGWATPTVITSDYLSQHNNTVTLTSFEDTNEFLLLPVFSNGEIEYNDTPLDEYLLIEFYTPTGLNQKDSRQQYANGLSTYSSPGVLVYHINASIGRIYLKGLSQSLTWDGCVYDKLPPMNEISDYEGYTYIFNNTRSYCYYQMDDSESNFYRGRLISLLPAIGRKIEGNRTGFSSNACLYREGDIFLLENGIYDNFVFDDGNKPQYGFEITDLDSESATLRFTSL